MSDVLKILVIEDLSSKYGDVTEKLKERLSTLPHEFTRAVDYEDAYAKLLTDQFDVAIVDLFIPQMGGDPSAAGSEALIRFMLSGQVHSPPQIIGLTQHGERIAKEGKVFADSMLLLEEYEKNSDVWADKIAGKIKYVSKSIQAASLYSAKRFSSDIVIVVAKYDTEFVPIEKKIKWVGEPRKDHPLFPNEIIRIGEVEIPRGQPRRVVLYCMNEMGVAASAGITAKLSMIFKPRLVTMLGMCCGFPKGISPSKLNDVILVEECACWDEGKYEEGYFDTEGGFKYRPRSLKGSADLLALAKKLVATDGAKWSNSLGRSANHRQLKAVEELKGEVRTTPKISIGKILSGLSVISDEEKVDTILARAPSALGLEMEIFGVYSALRCLKVLPIEFIAIKGVADFGVEKDSNLFDPVQPIASVSAYEVFRRLAESYFKNLSR